MNNPIILKIVLDEKKANEILRLIGCYEIGKKSKSFIIVKRRNSEKA